MKGYNLLPSEGVPISVLFISFVVLALTIVAGLYSERIKNKKIFIFWSLLAEYLFLVLCATVLCRQPRAESHMELMPFWIYMELTNGGHSVSPMDIVFNLLLFVPIGAFLAAINPSIKWYKVLLIGLACSITIEVSQFLLKRGVAQFDDLIHNSISCLIGWICTKWIIRLLNRNKT